jgi:tetratricopeptide (TPR) repeat protein
VRAAWLAAGVAAVVYALALGNGWAGDDMVAIRDNPAAHSIGAALDAWFDPYWPEDFRWAGLYRPFTIFTYGVDWSISGGATWWFHAVNVGLHAAVTGLVVLVVAPWLSGVGALAAGVLFAVHPVHVEAVANTVGRAELLVALGLLAMLLAARRYRRATSPKSRAYWLALTVMAVVVALCSKEHGVVAIALLALDHMVDAERAESDAVTLYWGVAVVTVAWLFLWRGIAGAYVAGAGHVGLAGLSPMERTATMLPAYLEVLRLLAWPFALASDYSPQVIPIRQGFTWLAVLGLASTTAMIALGVLSVKRAPVVAFGILAALVTYFPTSNLLVVSGVLIAERNLYLAVLAPACALGWGLSRVRERRHRGAALVVAGVVVLAFAYRSVERIPFWVDSETPIVEEQTAHPENFQTRVVLGRHLAALGDSSWALAELLVAGALLPTDPGAAIVAARHAAAQGRHRVALREARRALALAPQDPVAISRLAAAHQALGALDSVLAILRYGIDPLPRSVELVEQYRSALRATGAPRWRLLLVDAQRSWMIGDVVSASARLDSVAAEAAYDFTSEDACADGRRAFGVVRSLNPDLAELLASEAQSAVPGCSLHDE